MRPNRRLAGVLLLAFTCLACTGGTFSCSSGDKDDGDKIVVTGGRK